MLEGILEGMLEGILEGLLIDLLLDENCVCILVAQRLDGVSRSAKLVRRLMRKSWSVFFVPQPLLVISFLSTRHLK